MKSVSVIKTQIKRKTNKELVETIIIANKNKNWKELAILLSYPRRKKISVNLEKINSEAKSEKTIIVPGKVLSVGEINQKIKIAALNFSEKAKEKLLKAGCKLSSILDEIKQNKDAKNIKILGGKNEQK